MFGKKFFSTVALSGATVSLVGNVVSFAQGSVYVDGTKEIAEGDLTRKDVLHGLDSILEDYQRLLRNGEITEREVDEGEEKIEKICNDFLNDNYVDLDYLNPLDLESIIKESDYLCITEKGHKFRCALILGKYRGKKMLGIVVFEDGVCCFEGHCWIV